MWGKKVKDILWRDDVANYIEVLSYLINKAAINYAENPDTGVKTVARSLADLSLPRRERA